MFENKNSFVPPTFVGSNRAAMCSCTHKHRIIWPPACWTACTLDVSIKVSFHVNCFSVAVWRRSSPKSSKFVAGWKQWPRTLFVFFCSNQNGKQSGWQAHYIHVRPYFHTYSPAVLRSLGRSFAIPLFPWPLRPVSILSNGWHFFQFAFATMGYQMTTCKVLGITTSYGSKDEAAWVYSNPIGACFKSIFIILHLYFTLPFLAALLLRWPGFVPSSLWIWVWHCGPIKVTVDWHRAR